MTRRIHLVAALAGLSALFSPAAAQSFPEPLSVRPQVDERGVNVIDNNLLLGGLAGVSIGPDGLGGLSFSYLYTNSGWRASTIGTISNSGTVYSVSLGNSADTFTGPASINLNCGLTVADLGASTQGTGATLKFEANYDCLFETIEYQTWTYVDRNGVTYVFDKNLTGGKMLSSGVNQGVLTNVVYPTGDALYLSYEIIVLPGGNPPAAAARLMSISNDNGYRIHFDHASNTATQQSHFPDWRRITKATAFDIALEPTCGALSPTCSFANAWPSVTYTGAEFRIDTATDAAGRVTTFTHNTYSKLTGVRFPGSSSDNLSYAYASGGLGELTSVTVNGSVWGYSRVDSGGSRTVTVTNPLAQTDRTVVSTLASGLIQTDRDGLNNTTSYQYDAMGRVTQVTAPEGNYVVYGYDARGNQTSSVAVAKSGSGLGNITTSATYPASCTNLKTCNKPTSTTDALGKVTDYTYDATHGGVLTIVAPAPAAGGVRQQITYAYTQTGGKWRPTTITTCATAQTCAGAADESKTTIAYGAHLLPTTISAGGGDGALTATTTLTYTSAGDVATVDGPLSGTADTTFLFYDASRAPLGAIGPDPDGGGPLKRRATKTTYIANTALVNFTDQGTAIGTDLAALNAMASLARTDTDYDAYGRPVKVADIFSGVTQGVVQISYDAVGRTDCIAQRMNTAVFGSLPSSACNLSTAGSFGNDRITKNAYDVLGRVTAVTAAFGAPTSVQIQQSTTYTANGLVATVSDGKNNKTTYEYDGFDRLRRTLFPHPSTAGTSSSSDYEQLTYDTASRVTQRRLRDGQLIGFAYDFRSRLTGVDAPGTADDVTNTYDVLGRQLSSAIAGHTNSFAYDILGRLLSETSPQNGVNKTVSYQYDLAGRRTRVDYPADSGAAALWASYSYDETGAMTQVRANSSTYGTNALATYAYNDLGQRVFTWRGNGGATSYAYADPARRLSQIVHDLDGAGTANDLNINFTYSPASQIATRSASNNSYSWLGHFNEDVTDLLNGLNQPTMVGATSISHDARGNLTTDGVKIFTYDAQNRLVSTADGASFRYDPLGRLYEILKSGTTTRFLYDGAEAIAEYDASGALLRRYVRGAGPDEVVLWYEGTTLSDKRYLVTDERGSVIAGTDGAGATLFKNVYDEYGRPGSANQGRFQYTGQMWLAEAGLYHYKARIYDPGLGRFLQTDPIGYADGLNLYAYVGGDPVNSTDPTGTLLLFSAGGGSCVHACSEGTSPSAFGGAGFNNVFGFGGAVHGGGGGGGGGGSVPPPGPHSNPSPFINTGIQQIASLTPPDRFACTDPYGCITTVGYRDTRREGLEAARDFLNQAIRQALIDVLVSGIQNFAEETRQSEGAEELCELGNTLVVAGRLETYVGAGGVLVGGYLAGYGRDLRVRGTGLAIGVSGAAFALLGVATEDTGRAYQYFYCAR